MSPRRGISISTELVHGFEKVDIEAVVKLKSILGMRGIPYEITTESKY